MRVSTANLNYTKHILKRMCERAIKKKQIELAIRFGEISNHPVKKELQVFTLDKLVVVVAANSKCVLTCYREDEWP